MVMKDHGTQRKSGPINMCLIAFAGKYFIYGIGLFTGSVDYEKHITFCQLYVFYMKKKQSVQDLKKQNIILEEMQFI